MFHALADRTRRDIVRCVLTEELSVSTLARRYPMSFAAVQKHVAVLADAGLVSKHRSGREQLVRGEPRAIEATRRVLDAYEEIWRDRLDRFGALLAEETGGDR